jgi:hypothetical protein
MEEKKENEDKEEYELALYAQNKEQNVITKQKKYTTKVWKRKKQQEENTSMSDADYTPSTK